MDLLYDILEKLLPFSWAEYNFMKNALLAVIIITPLFGILGTMVINNRMAFFGLFGTFCSYGNCSGNNIWHKGYEYIHGFICCYIRSSFKFYKTQKDYVH